MGLGEGEGFRKSNGIVFRRGLTEAGESFESNGSHGLVCGE